MITYDMLAFVPLEPKDNGSKTIHEFLDRIDLKKLGKYWIFEDYNDYEGFYIHEFDTKEEWEEYIEDNCRTNRHNDGDCEIVEKGTHAIFINTW